MAAAIAHEVKNPLAGIEVMAGVLKRQLTESEDAQSILRDIIKEAKMANAIVLEVLDFVRPIRLQVERVSLADVVRDAISMAESHIARGEVQIAGRAAGGPGADPGRSAPAAAAVHQPADQRLRGARRDGARSHRRQAAAGRRRAVRRRRDAGADDSVEVSDDGPGIPADVMERIFSPFFTTKPQGSGLGLAIVRKIVDAHDGRIDVSARPEGGTRFRVTLPVSGSHRAVQVTGRLGTRGSGSGSESGSIRESFGHRIGNSQY